MIEKRMSFVLSLTRNSPQLQCYNPLGHINGLPRWDIILLVR